MLTSKDRTGIDFLTLRLLQARKGWKQTNRNGKVTYSAVPVLRIYGQLPLADEPKVDDQENADGSGGHARLHHAYQEEDMDETEIWDDFYMRLLTRSQNRNRRGGHYGDDTGDIVGDDTDDFLGDGTGDFPSNDSEDILWELGCLVCDLLFTQMNFNSN